MKWRSVAIAVLAALVFFAACGDDGDSDESNGGPDVSVDLAELPDQIAAALVESFGVSEENADCVAAALIAGGFSDGALAAMADDTLDFPEDEAATFAQTLQDSVVACTSEATDEPRSDLATPIAAELVASLKLSQERADCVAARLVRGEFSEEAFAAMADPAKTFPTDEASAFALALRDNVLACAAGGLTEQISASLVRSFGVSKDVADCVTTRLVDGDFSDQALQAVADDTNEFPPDEADKFVQALQAGVVDCS